MSSTANLEGLLAMASPEVLMRLADVFRERNQRAERVAAVEQALRDFGQPWRDQIGLWIADLLEVDKLVPGPYEHWRALVRACMAFFASHFPGERLAEKIVEQIEIPPDTPAESRLGLLISRTPGLQKIGQVLARNRRLSPLLRAELQKLENGIHDVTAGEIRRIVEAQLGASIDAYGVELAPALLSEASVSAVLGFTWLNPASAKREEGVFKVMKPHIPSCYAEDLALLQDLAEHLVSTYSHFGAAAREVADTLTEVRLLLEREVDFRREQATLLEVGRVYRRSGVHAPTPMIELSTETITAMSLERGVKVTEAFHHRKRWGVLVATRAVEALIADPLLSDQDFAVFHADPHAGNLLYDEVKDELIVLDWALTGRLSREERRQMARLIAMMTLRDSGGVRDAIYELSSGPDGAQESARDTISRCVTEFFRELPFVCSPGAIDAMRLLDRVGVEGVRFPASLVLIRKVLFSLDGVLRDVAGQDVRFDFIVAREFIARWMKRPGGLPGPFTLKDFLAVERSALLYASGLWAWTN